MLDGTNVERARVKARSQLGGEARRKSERVQDGNVIYLSPKTVFSSIGDRGECTVIYSVKTL